MGDDAAVVGVNKIMIVVNEGDFGCLTLAVDVLESKYPEDTNK